MVRTQNPDLLQQAEQIDKAVTEAGNMKEILIREIAGNFRISEFFNVVSCKP